MVCIKCAEPIESSYTTDAGGYKHIKCYDLDHPFKEKLTFADVIHNSDDQVLVRELLMDYIRHHDKDTIVSEFNRIMKERYARRIA